jgi:gliding motility-associated protein GldL
MSAKYRLTHELTGREKFYQNVAPVITGVGASVVILGALFKIMHWPGAGLMLIIGLGTEAVLFFLFAFAPPTHEPDWTIVYPELAEDESGTPHVKESDRANTKNLTNKLGDMMDHAGLNQDVIGKLSSGIRNLTESVGNMSDLSNAAAASNEYANNVKAASKSILEMNKSYATTVEAMSAMANASTDAKEYHSQVQEITKNLGALNAVYQMELQDANNHLKAMNKFYGNLSSAMEAMADASKDTQQFKQELSKLTTNLTSLNTVYGSMLSAMRG